jgi:hypothetical protein
MSMTELEARVELAKAAASVAAAAAANNGRPDAAAGMAAAVFVELAKLTGVKTPKRRK